MNNFDTIIENKPDFFIIKNKVITFKNVKLKWEQKSLNSQVVNLCITFIPLIKIEQDK